jgi:hypothetical protein
LPETFERRISLHPAKLQIALAWAFCAPVRRIPSPGASTADSIQLVRIGAMYAGLQSFELLHESVFSFGIRRPAQAPLDGFAIRREHKVALLQYNLANDVILSIPINKAVQVIGKGEKIHLSLKRESPLRISAISS